MTKHPERHNIHPHNVAHPHHPNNKSANRIIHHARPQIKGTGNGTHHPNNPHTVPHPATSTTSQSAGLKAQISSLQSSIANMRANAQGSGGGSSAPPPDNSVELAAIEALSNRDTSKDTHGGIGGFLGALARTFFLA